MEILAKLEPEWVDIDDVGFLCAPLTAAQRVTTFSLVESDIGEAYARMARYAVKDWRGVTRGGQPVPFSAAALDEFFADGDHGPVLLMLGNKILVRSALSETERKNS